MKTTEQFKNDLKSKHPHLYRKIKITGEYTGAQRRILVEDKYGELFVSATSLLSGHIPNIISATNKTVYWTNMAIEVHGFKYGYEKVDYIKNSIKVKIYCKKCGEYFYVTPSNHLAGKDCPCSKIEKIALSQIDSFEKFMEELRNKNKYVFDNYEIKKENYVGKNKDIIINGKYGKNIVKAGYLLLGNRPSIRSAVDADDYIKRMFIEIHGKGIYSYDDMVYINNTEHVKIYCEKCKKHFYCSPSNHLSGKGCPRCRFSRGEKEIAFFMENNFINFISQYKFDDCKNIKALPFDFYLTDKNICIEYDGIQHYEVIPHFGGEDRFIEVKRNDTIKTEYCNNNGIKLIRIPYYEFNKIDDILREELV